MRFEEAAEGIVTEYRTNGRKTLGHVERRIRLHLEPFFGGRRMAAITTGDTPRFVDQRQAAGASNAEINRELAILKRLYSLAMHDGTLLTRPHIPMLAEHNVRTGFFTRAQIEAVLGHLPAPVQPVIRFAYLTGWLVPSEVLTLEWRQVDFRAGTVWLEVGTAKNEDGRLFPFDVLPELGDLLTAQRRVTSQVEQEQGRIVPWVFHRNGKGIRRFSAVWATACRAAGCPGRVPHDMRRSAVRNLIRAGVPEKTAMLLTGHKSRSVFDRYDIVNEADLREAVRKLGAGTDGYKISDSRPITARAATTRSETHPMKQGANAASRTRTRRNARTAGPEALTIPHPSPLDNTGRGLGTSAHDRAHLMIQSSVWGPDRYSGDVSDITSVSSSRMIVTSWSSHSGTGTVTANSSDTQSPSFRVLRGWSP